MSANLTAYAELKTGLEAVVADVARLKATQPNLEYFAQQIGGHLVKFEADVTSNFTDKFAGNLFRATDAWNIRVVDIEETLATLEKMIEANVAKYDDMLGAHHTRTAKMLKAQEKFIADTIANYEQKLTEQRAKVDELLKILAGYDRQFVDLYNGSLHLVNSNETTLGKVDAVVDKFDRISSETLQEVTETATESIKLAVVTGKQEMDKMVAETRMQIEGTRKHYLKVLSGFDNRFAEHPMLAMAMFVMVIAIAFGVIGVWAGRIGEAQHTQRLVDAAVDSATEKVEERMQRIEEQTKSLNDTFQEAQMWEALTNNMSFDEKMKFIKQAQEMARRQGRKLDLPKAMQEQPGK